MRSKHRLRKFYSFSWNMSKTPFAQSPPTQWSQRPKKIKHFPWTTHRPRRACRKRDSTRLGQVLLVCVFSHLDFLRRRRGAAALGFPAQGPPNTSGSRPGPTVSFRNATAIAGGPLEKCTFWCRQPVRRFFSGAIRNKNLTTSQFTSKHGVPIH